MFRFTIRDVILVTLIVAIRAAWWVDHRNIADRIVAQAKRREAVYDEYTRLTRMNAFIEPGPPQSIEWIKRDADWWPSGPPARQDQFPW